MQEHKSGFFYEDSVHVDYNSVCHSHQIFSEREIWNTL